MQRCYCGCEVSQTLLHRQSLAPNGHALTAGACAGCLLSLAPDLFQDANTRDARSFRAREARSGLRGTWDVSKLLKLVRLPFTDQRPFVEFSSFACSVHRRNFWRLVTNR